MPQGAALEIQIAVASCGDSLSEWVPRAPLSENEIQVWHARTPYGGDDLSCLKGWLAADEIFRAERFRFARDRNQFITCRGLLRILLSSYVGAAPGDIQFEY